MNENELLEYLSHVLLDFDDERCQAHLKRMLPPQEETDRSEEQAD